MTTPYEKEYMRKYRSENADRIRASNKAWREANRDINLPKKRAKAKQYRENNPEVVKEIWKRTYAKNRVKFIAGVTAWVAKNPERVKQNFRKCHLKLNYGITVEQWDQMFQSQGSACAICRTTEPHGKRKQWDTDHCHTTGRVRGILCHPCNLMLGGAKDNPETLAAGMRYLTDRP